MRILFTAILFFVCQLGHAQCTGFNATAVLISDLSCYNAYGWGDGEATVTHTGGTAPYSYLWDNSETNLMATSLTGGWHYVSVFDGNGCVETDSVLVGVPDELSAEITLLMTASCTGLSDGSALIFASGGTPGYTYNWDTGSISQVGTGLSSGIHTATVTDDNGCSTTAKVNASGDIIILSQTDSNCPNCDGTIDLSSSGKPQPVSYLWEDGNTSSYRNGLCEGTYHVTLTDGNQCETDYVIDIGMANFGISSIDMAGLHCHGASNGVATVNVTGGITPYTFLWDNGESTQTASNLYFKGVPNRVTVTDGVGCTDSKGYSFTFFPYSSLSVNNTIKSTCGSCDGAVSAYSNGSTFQWSTGSTQPTLYNLCPGIYTVSATSTYGCTNVRNIEVSVDQQNVVAKVTKLKNYIYNCSPETGRASASLTNGLAPFTFQWSTGETTNIATGLLPGFNTVTVTDSRGCFNYNQFYVTQNTFDPVLLSQPASCSAADGEITIDFHPTFNNGTTYQWSNGATSRTVSNLSAGIYSVTIENQNKECIATRSYSLEEDSICAVDIEGTIYYDKYLQSCLASYLVPQENQMLLLTNGIDSIYTFSDQDGNYLFVVDTGTYILKLINLIDQATSCPLTDTVLIDAPSYSRHKQDFYLRGSFSKDLGVKAHSTSASRPGFTRYSRLYYFNRGQNTESAVITLVHNPHLTNFYSPGANYNPLTRTATFTANISSAQLLQRAYTGKINGPLGRRICDTLTITPLIGDDFPSNNTFVYCSTIQGAYDPNDKQNIACEDPFGGEIYDFEKPFFYHIRFQNTGTDTAFTVSIKDTLDSNLDIETIRPIGASHGYSVDMLEGNVLEFLFENIMLPDSNVNEAASHGYAIFEINLKDNLPIGTTIENSVGIYFDFNAPVITNTVVNTLAAERTGLLLDLTLFLEGPFDSSTGLMQDNLRAANLIPEIEPYTNLGYTNAGSGQESILPHILDITGPNAIVDWVFLELRSSIDFTDVVATRSALLKANGEVVDVDGHSAVLFRNVPDGNYFIVAKHRNHLGIMTPGSIELVENQISSVDFTTGSTYGPLNISLQKHLGGGLFGLFSGDVNQTGSIDSGDRSDIWNFRNQQGYLIQDSSLDGYCDSVERSMAWNNRNRVSYVP